MKYFMPRYIMRLVADICEVMKSGIVLDPVYSTGGFLVACMDLILQRNHLSHDQTVKIVNTASCRFQG